jgi:hypothetical protein
MSTNQEIDNSTYSEENISQANSIEDIVEWVNQLKDANTRVNALIQLSKKREAYPDLALFLWYAPGIISVL